MSSSLAKQQVYSIPNMKTSSHSSGSGGGGIEAGLQREPVVAERLRGKASLKMKPEGADLGAAAVILTGCYMHFKSAELGGRSNNNNNTGWSYGIEHLVNGCWGTV